MSYQIRLNIDTEGNVVLHTDKVENAPAGAYTITGHVHTPGTAGEFISMATPQGNVQAALVTPAKDGKVV